MNFGLVLELISFILFFFFNPKGLAEGSRPRFLPLPGLEAFDIDSRFLLLHESKVESSGSPLGLEGLVEPKWLEPLKKKKKKIETLSILKRLFTSTQAHSPMD